MVLKSDNDETAGKREDWTTEYACLVGLGRRLATAGSLDGLRDALKHSLPEFSHIGGMWVLIRTDNKWEAVAGELPGTPYRTSPVLEVLADRVLRLSPDALEAYEGSEWEGNFCFPMVVDGAAVGVLGLRKDENQRGEHRRLMAVIANVLAIATRNVQLLREINERDVYDELTGCFNRTHGMKAIDAELQRSRRSQAPLALIMFDLDYFKSVNDRHGHLCGDAVLALVGKRVHDLMRENDVKCRYGGDEFLILLPDTPYDVAAGFADLLRRDLSLASVFWEGEQVSTTVSVGIAVPGTGEFDARTLIGRADVALYRAKNKGRHRVCVDSKWSNTTNIPLPVKHGASDKLTAFPESNKKHRLPANHRSGNR